MSENRLVINTKKSLYDPIEIEIDGQVYYSLKTTKSVLKEINKIDEEIGKKKENHEALYKVVQLMFDVDMKILEKLDTREVEDIYLFSKKRFVEIEKERLKLIEKSFGMNLGLKETQQAKKTVPQDQKKPGNKR